MFFIKVLSRQCDRRVVLAILLWPGARPSYGERAPGRRAARALIFRSWLFFAGEAGLLGACSCFSDTLLAAMSAADRFTGFITNVGEDSLEIATRPGTSRTVRTTGSTRYIKWVTHQPWQQPTTADRTSLQVDRCVQVQLQSGEQAVAGIIRINTDQPGSIGDPCRRLRAPRPAK
jgi:hypothetical protein